MEKNEPPKGGDSKDDEKSRDSKKQDANAAAGVGSYRDLPNPPAPIYVMIDEFTSLMGQSPVPKPSEDAKLELGYW